MQFYTAELQDIINQLSQGGMAGGYFQTLGLIFRFLGLIIWPILAFVALIAIFFALPRFIVRKLLTPARLKQITRISVSNWSINLYINEYSAKYKDICFVFFGISLALAIFYVILVSPFFFVTGAARNVAFVIISIVLVLILGNLLLSWIIFTGWIGTAGSLNEFPMVRDLREKVRVFCKTLERNEDENFLLDRKDIIKQLTETFGDQVAIID